MERKHIARNAVIGLCLVSVLALPSTAHADGGIITQDPNVWAELEEGNQIAVVRLGEDDTAQVDLFVSLLDASGESHEIIFFVPLGVQPSDFGAVEEFLWDFVYSETDELDRRLFDAALEENEYREDLHRSLLPGFLISQPGLLWPFWCAFTACGAAGTLPLETFETEHSTIELYDLDAETDLTDLAATSGLDAAVRETLRRLEGQRIAVVRLQTVAMGGGYTGKDTDAYSDPYDTLGLHLTWTAGLVPDEEGMSYAYPLGTGGAWAHPIGMTRVYVLAPAGIDFSVTYPQVGIDLSGYTSGFFGGVRSRIADSAQPSFAVDEAVDDHGRIWRATYVQSNAVEDIVITRVDGPVSEIPTSVYRQALERWASRITLVVGILVAVVIWVIAWRTVMSNMLGFSYSHWFDRQLWKQAGMWMGIYLVFNFPALLLPFTYSSTFFSGYLLPTLFNRLEPGQRSYLCP